MAKKIIKNMADMKSQPENWLIRDGIGGYGLTPWAGFSDSPTGSKENNHRGEMGGMVLCKDDLQLVLGPRCTPGFLNGAQSLEREICQGTICEESRDGDHILVDLSLGLTQSSGLELPTNSFHSSREVDSSMTSSRHIFSDMTTQAHHEAGLQRVTTFPQPSGSDAIRDRGTLVLNRVDSSSRMGLHLSLTGNPLSADSDCLSGMLSCSAGANAQESEVDATLDEGSTNAAKRMKRKDFSIPGLRNCDFWMDQSSLVHVAIETKEGLANPDYLLSSKSRPISTMACVAFSGGGQTSSSIGTERAKKRCKFQGCSKGARGASGLCITHGGGRRCQRLNCNKGAESYTNFCKAHGGGRRCQNLGCIRSAEGKTDFCIGHGGGRRCNYEGCAKAARGKSGLCIRHGGGKRCQREGCTKSAEGFSGLCISHGGGRRCQYLGCGKGAQGSTMFCKGHGGGKRCVFEGCTKGAEGSTPLCKAHGGGRRCTFGGGTCTKSVHGGTLFCVAHGGGKRCSVQGCTKSARGRTDFCVKHGGGKRCKHENCSKSAQGSTDFCKAHGGGKRCLWCQEGSVCNGSSLFEKDNDHLKGHCGKFARGKTGLCAVHSAFVQQPTASLDSMHSEVLPQSMSFPNCQIPQRMSEQSMQSASPNDHGLKLPSDAETQLLYCGRNSIEASCRSNSNVESALSHAAGAKGQAGLKNCFTSVAGLKGMPFDGRDTGVAKIAFLDCSFSSHQIPPHSASESSINITDSVGAGVSSLANARYIQQNMANHVSRQSSTLSKLSNKQVLLPGVHETLVEKMQQGQYDPLKLAPNDLSMFSLPALDERVHGGRIMALLEREAARQHYH